MKPVAEILAKLLIIAQNTKTWLKVIVLILVCGGTFAIGAIAFSKTKNVKDAACEKQREELIQALIEIRRDLSTASFIQPNFIQASFASFDTLPKRTVKQQQQQQQIQYQKQKLVQKKVVNKIDSILLKHSPKKM